MSLTFPSLTQAASASKTHLLGEFEEIKDILDNPVTFFNQCEFGDDEILGDGACMGLNVNIIIQLQKTPKRDESTLRKIFLGTAGPKKKAIERSSAEILCSMGEYDDIAEQLRKARIQELGGNSRFCPSIRFLQAAHEMMCMHSKGREVGIPQKILAIKGIQHEKVRNVHYRGDNIDEAAVWCFSDTAKAWPDNPYATSSIEGFVDDLSSQLDLLERSMGFVAVDMEDLLGSEEGHSVTLEINHRENRYTIIDVNQGVYSCSSCTQLKKLFRMFVESVYAEEDYDLFTANVFYPIT